MQSVLGAVGSAVTVFEKLVPVVAKYQDRRKAKEEFLDALGEEIGAFNHFYEQIAANALGRLMPLLDSMMIAQSRTTMNDIYDYLADFYQEYASLLECLIALAQRCKQVSGNAAFMDFLKETRHRLEYDFIVRMGALVHGDSIKIDNEYYVFFKLYKREIFGKLDRARIEEETKALEDKTKGYGKMLKRMLRAFRRVPVNRVILKRFIRNYKKLDRVAQKVDVRPTKTIELADCLPSEMLPVVMLLDEAFPSEGLLTTNMRYT